MSSILDEKCDEFKLLWDKDLKYNLSARLRDFRVRKGVTQKELAEYIGISPVTLSRMENGTMKISAKVLFGYYYILGFSIDELLKTHKAELNKQLVDVIGKYVSLDGQKALSDLIFDLCEKEEYRNTKNKPNT